MFPFVWVWPHIVRQGGGVYFWWSKVQRETEGLGRAGAGLKPEWKEHSQMDFSFLCCLVGHQQSVMSRSQTWSSDPAGVSARTQLWQPSVISRLHPHYSNTLKTLKKNQSGLCCTWSLIISSFWFVWKARKLDGNSVLLILEIPRCCLTVCSRTLSNKWLPKCYFHTLYWVVSMTNRAHVSV